MKKQVPDEFIGHAAAIMERCLAGAGIDERRARRLVVDVMDQLRRHLGGQQVYIPFGRPPADERAALIYEMWEGGMKVKDIAAELGVSAIWAYRLLAQERRRLTAIGKSARLSAIAAGHITGESP